MQVNTRILHPVLLLFAAAFYLLKNVLDYSPLYINILNDLVALPVLLAVMQCIMRGIYGSRFNMNLAYVLATCLVTGMMFEVIFPLYKPQATADPLDLLLYLAGALWYYFLVIRQPATKSPKA